MPPITEKRLTHWFAAKKLSSSSDGLTSLINEADELAKGFATSGGFASQSAKTKDNIPALAERLFLLASAEEKLSGWGFDQYQKHYKYHEQQRSSGTSYPFQFSVPDSMKDGKRMIELASSMSALCTAYFQVVREPGDHPSREEIEKRLRQVNFDRGTKPLHSSNVQAEQEAAPSVDNAAGRMSIEEEEGEKNAEKAKEQARVSSDLSPRRDYQELAEQLLRDNGEMLLYHGVCRQYEDHQKLISSLKGSADWESAFREACATIHGCFREFCTARFEYEQQFRKNIDVRHLEQSDKSICAEFEECRVAYEERKSAVRDAFATIERSTESVKEIAQKKFQNEFERFEIHKKQSQDCPSDRYRDSSWFNNLLGGTAQALCRPGGLDFLPTYLQGKASTGKKQRAPPDNGMRYILACASTASSLETSKQLALAYLTTRLNLTISDWACGKYSLKLKDMTVSEGEKTRLEKLAKEGVEQWGRCQKAGDDFESTIRMKIGLTNRHSESSEHTHQNFLQNAGQYGQEIAKFEKIAAEFSGAGSFTQDNLPYDLRSDLHWYERLKAMVKDSECLEASKLFKSLMKGTAGEVLSREAIRDFLLDRE